MGQEGVLCIHHPKFGQVTAGFGFFSTEYWTKVKDTAQSHSSSFKIELTRLTQESRLTEVICFKKFCWIFRCISWQNRAVKLDKAILVKEVVSGIDNSITDLLDSYLLAGTKPEMTIIHEEVCTVFFWRDGVINWLTDNFQIGHIQLIAKFGALVFFDNTGHIDWGFLAQAFDGIKLGCTFFFTEFFDEVWFEGYGLEKGSAVSQLKESNLTFPRLVGHPGTDGDFLTYMLRNIKNRN